MEFSNVQAVATTYVRQGSKWVFNSSEIIHYSKEQYLNFISKDTLMWFRRLGSRQVLVNSSTSFGRLCVQLSSYSPCGEEKKVYNFRFIQ